MPLSDSDITHCEGLLTYDECWQPMKSPGHDGLTVEFYEKKRFYLFGPKLVAYHNSVFVWGKLTPFSETSLNHLIL